MVGSRCAGVKLLVHDDQHVPAPNPRLDPKQLK